ncbi:UvrD-helicase domain-containing protein [Jeotgalibaca porci]|uniref:UvrD-helicase domain-containing protein n=1 Tax=Jeotgalibaca porci TaxID=1868793 RepID=UPI001D0581F8|nr:UvrD-helicase domain-containing protein [Jeotgalibaca porci]
MVKEILIEPEVKQALEYIKNGDNFILTGGAGSGKTYSLISLIHQVKIKYSNMPIVCITYTNNAVYEIEDRISNERLYVSTIHEFLWDILKRFQGEIKSTLVELINDDDEKIFRLPKGINEIDNTYFGNFKINYDEYYNIVTGQDSTVTHDHVLILAEKMFEKYKKLCDVLKDTAQLILIDEYQDTAPQVVRILLKHIKKSKKKMCSWIFW